MEGGTSHSWIFISGWVVQIFGIVSRNILEESQIQNDYFNFRSFLNWPPLIHFRKKFSEVQNKSCSLRPMTINGIINGIEENITQDIDLFNFLSSMLYPYESCVPELQRPFFIDLLIWLWGWII